jgi:hypothetical protein
VPDIPFLRDVASDPGQGDGSSHNGSAHIVFGGYERLGSRHLVSFSVQSHTPQDCRVRFAVVVTFHDATLATGRALPLTRAGLPPAGTRQLPGAPHYKLKIIMALIHLPRQRQPGAGCNSDLNHAYCCSCNCCRNLNEGSD